MTRRFIVRPLAEADLEDAARWYEDERAGTEAHPNWHATFDEVAHQTGCDNRRAQRSFEHEESAVGEKHRQDIAVQRLFKNASVEHVVKSVDPARHLRRRGAREPMLVWTEILNAHLV